MDTQQTYTFASSPDDHQLGTSQLGMRLPHHRLARVMWGSAALMGLVLLAGLTAQLGGCMLSGGTTIYLTDGEGSGGGTRGEDTGDGGTTDGSGTSGSGGPSSSTGDSSGSGSSDSTGSFEPICAVEGLECICDGTRSDPFDCVDECLWVDAPPDCMCDGMTSPPEWCEAAPCVLEGLGEDMQCVCAGLPAPVTWCN